MTEYDQFKRLCIVDNRYVGVIESVHGSPLRAPLLVTIDETIELVSMVLMAQHPAGGAPMPFRQALLSTLPFCKGPKKVVVNASVIVDALEDFDEKEYRDLVTAVRAQLDAIRAQNSGLLF